MTGNRRPIGVYIHIPFCVKKCAYCDFLSMQADSYVKDRYLSVLERDLEETVTTILEEQYEIDTVFIGGGTPSSLYEKQLEKLCCIVRKMLERAGSRNRKAEVTIECNPGTLNTDKIKILKEYGINRISLGLQSADDRELEILGRIHRYRDFLECYELLREWEFDNINIDIMSALPAQTLKTYVQTLEKVARLSPRHISAYSLIIEAGTPFYEKYAADDNLRRRGKKPLFLPDEECEREMYRQTEEILHKYNYNRYEISNYSKPGYECKHNVGYWKGKAYIGTGIGAASYMPDKRNNDKHCPVYLRYNRTVDLTKYLEGDFGRYEEEIIDINMQMEEFMFLGLRMMRGISRKEFMKKFNCDIEKVYGRQLENFSKEGLLDTRDVDIVCLTGRGIDVSNYVFEGFLTGLNNRPPD